MVKNAWAIGGLAVRRRVAVTAFISAETRRGRYHYISCSAYADELGHALGHGAHLRASRTCRRPSAV